MKVPVPSLPSLLLPGTAASAGSSPADASDGEGIQLVADELPRKPHAEGASDALTLPGARWSRPGCGLFLARYLGVLARLFPVAFVTPAGREASWMHGEADGGAWQRQSGKENQVRRDREEDKETRRKMDVLGKWSICCGSQCCWDRSVGQKLKLVMLKALLAHCFLPCNTTEWSLQLAGAQHCCCAWGLIGSGGTASPAQRARGELQTGRAEAGASPLPSSSSREASPASPDQQAAQPNTARAASGQTNPTIAYSFPPGPHPTRGCP